jgi:hypothetical protein
MKATIAAAVVLVAAAVDAQMPETGRPGTAPDGSVLLHDGWRSIRSAKTDVGTFPTSVVPLPRRRPRFLAPGRGAGEGLERRPVPRHPGTLEPGPDGAVRDRVARGEGGAD